MKLYNTLSQQLETLKPNDPPSVTIYTCGPTVYDYPHIGNWFTFIRYDLLVRTIKGAGLEPKWVMNITDVGHLTSDADEGEDKLEKGARREGKTAWDIAKYYGDYFTDGLKRLNFFMPWQLPKATEHIAEQINMVKQLEAKGYTYQLDDGIYYDTAKFPNYKNFARLDLDEQQAGLRVATNPNKHNPSDFALWKFSPKDKTRDMEWDSPWGKGFPGWHIECSAMCLKYLGETVDIHCGGIDHIPIHHTNEIAQSQAVTGKPLANLWMHTNHILIDDQKISKSLGNSLTLEQIEERGISLPAFRLYVIESHYRSQSKFSWEGLKAAQNRLLRYKNFAVKRFQVEPEDAKDIPAPDILKPMEEDLNTPLALASIEEYINKIESTPASIASIKAAIQIIDDILGLDLNSTKDISDDQKRLISERMQARTDHDWQKSDELRDILAQQNIGLNDLKDYSAWYYLS